MHIRFLFTFDFCIRRRLNSFLYKNAISWHIFLMSNLILIYRNILNIILIHFENTIAWIFLLKSILILINHFLKWFYRIRIINAARLIFIRWLNPNINKTIAFNNTINRYLIKILWLNAMLTQKTLTILKYLLIRCNENIRNTYACLWYIL